MNNDSSPLAWAVIVVVLAIIAICSGLAWNGNEYVISGIVERTYVKRADKQDKFFVVVRSDDGQTHILQNSDTFFRFKFGSADVQGQLKDHHRYSFKVVGWRLPLFSVFPNIISVQEVNSNGFESTQPSSEAAGVSS